MYIYDTSTHNWTVLRSQTGLIIYFRVTISRLISNEAVLKGSSLLFIVKLVLRRTEPSLAVSCQWVQQTAFTPSSYPARHRTANFRPRPICGRYPSCKLHVDRYDMNHVSTVGLIRFTASINIHEDASVGELVIINIVNLYNQYINKK